MTKRGFVRKAWINLLLINRFPFRKTETKQPNAWWQTFNSSVGPSGVLRLSAGPRRCRRGLAVVSSGFYRWVSSCSCSSCRPTVPPGLRRSPLSAKPTAGARKTETSPGSPGAPGPWAPRLRCPARPGRRIAERRRWRVWWWCDRSAAAPAWASPSLPSAIPFHLRIRLHPRLPEEKELKMRMEGVCPIQTCTFWAKKWNVTLEYLYDTGFPFLQQLDTFWITYCLHNIKNNYHARNI